MKYQLQLWHGSWQSVLCPREEVELAAREHLRRPNRLWRVIDLTTQLVVAGEGSNFYYQPRGTYLWYQWLVAQQ